MSRALLPVVSLLLLALPACKQEAGKGGLECGPGTEEQEGQCVPAEDGGGDTGSTNPQPEGSTAGDCGDGEDNDRDGLVDCDDDGCAGAADCVQVDTGEPTDSGDSGDTEPDSPPVTFAVISRNNADGEVIIGADRGLSTIDGSTPNSGAVIVCGVSTSTGLLSCSFESTLEMPTWRRYIVDNVPYGDFTAVEVDESHACALATTGEVVCWGEQWTAGGSPADAVFVDVAVGRTWTCGLREDGVAYCWGEDPRGSGVLSPPDGRYLDLFGGHDTPCGHKDDGSIVCWGGIGDGRPLPSLAGQYAQAHAQGGSLCGISVDRTTIRCAIPTLNDGGLDYNYCILNPPQLAFGDTRRFDEVRVAAMLGAGGAAVTYDDGSMDVWGGYSVLSYDFSWGTGVECVYPWN